MAELRDDEETDGAMLNHLGMAAPGAMPEEPPWIRQYFGSGREGFLDYIDLLRSRLQELDLEKRCLQNNVGYYMKRAEQAESALKQAQAEAREMREDTERYRFLKDIWDSALDAARAKRSGEEK